MDSITETINRLQAAHNKTSAAWAQRKLEKAISKCKAARTLVQQAQGTADWAEHFFAKPA